MAKGLRLVFTLACLASQAAAATPPPEGHFVDAMGNTLEKLEPVWVRLQGFFGDAMPQEISVRWDSSGVSRFSPGTQTVFLSLKHQDDQARMREVLAHEGAHLALASLTNGASVGDGFRFLDEGFASIRGAIESNELADYREKALTVAFEKMAEGDADLAKLVDWPGYFREPKAGRWFTYEVGASFVFFLLDRGGENSLHAFFKSLGRQPDLDAALGSHYKLTRTEAEAQWRAWVAKHKPARRPESLRVPKVIARTPEHGAKGVSTDVDVLEVRFDVDMAPDICFVADCKDGICYKNASWSDKRTLKIYADRRLTPGHTYRMSLGFAKEGCLFRSAKGTGMPELEWIFSTAGVR